MRSHENYENDAYQTCDKLFGDMTKVATGGFPPRVNSERIYVIQAVDIAGEPITEIAPVVATREGVAQANNNASNNNTSASAPASSGSQGTKIAFVGAAAGLAVMAYALADGDISAFTWKPHAQVRYDNGNSFYAYGSRLDFAKEQWRMHWTAAQTRRNGSAQDWRYGTGVNWTGEVFSAGFTNQVQGLDSDAELSFAARHEFNIWTLESSYVSDWAFTELNTTWANRLELGARIDYNQWLITPRAELSWRPDVTESKDLRFRIEFLRDL
jgi:hypothetical protein